MFHCRLPGPLCTQRHSRYGSVSSGVVRCRTSVTTPPAPSKAVFAGEHVRIALRNGPWQHGVAVVLIRRSRPEAVSDCRGLKFLKANRRELAAYPENMKEHCCKRMQDQVEPCDVHQSQSECPDALITYRAKFDDYGIRVHDGGSSSITILVVRTRTRQNDLGS